MTPDFECGMIVGGGGVFLATIIFAVGWHALVVRSDIWRNE
ncbi:MULTISPECIES: hypothetical protein [Acetobacter]|uniref:Uncharacterized protein n=1 Tax=Acetobacter pasteurianus subsp. pasteurianus TaxID=481145 RepID=A0A1Y0XXD6_ACEPA|nr:hypothetical protein [Acetobacter pasteurianus]ARW47560.1 hypothetical protein S1001342_01228 [Acetobacter pasteurianus subsp. pasteurianus]